MTFEKVRRLICQQLGKKEDQVALTSDIVEDLGADSLDVVEMLMAFEEEFDMTLSDEACARLRTVEDVVNYIDSHKKK